MVHNVIQPCQVVSAALSAASATPGRFGLLTDGSGQIAGLSGPADGIVEHRRGDGLLRLAPDGSRPVGLLPAGIAALAGVGAGVERDGMLQLSVTVVA